MQMSLKWVMWSVMLKSSWFTTLVVPTLTDVSPLLPSRRSSVGSAWRSNPRPSARSQSPPGSTACRRSSATAVKLSARRHAAASRPGAKSPPTPTWTSPPATWSWWVLSCQLNPNIIKICANSPRTSVVVGDISWWNWFERCIQRLGGGLRAVFQRRTESLDD